MTFDRENTQGFTAPQIDTLNAAIEQLRREEPNVDEKSHSDRINDAWVEGITLTELVGAARVGRARADNTERWYKFGGSNLQAQYGYGTADEASRYAEYLDRGREIDHYTAYALGGDAAEEDALVAALDNQQRNDGFTLSEALTEIDANDD